MLDTLQGAGGLSLLSSITELVGKRHVSLTIKGTSRSPLGQSMSNESTSNGPFLSKVSEAAGQLRPVPPGVTHRDVAEDEEEGELPEHPPLPVEVAAGVDGGL